MFVVLSMVAVLLALAGIQVRFALRRRKLAGRGWQEVLSAAEAVNVEGLQRIADCYLQPDNGKPQIETDEMWRVVGGLNGLHHLRANANTMLEMAILAERWNDETGCVVSEFMRRDAARFKKCLTRVELSLLYGFGRVRTPFALQEAVASYCLLRARLFSMYKITHVARIPFLEASL